jgi:NAD(P)H-hydrate epimerase
LLKRTEVPKDDEGRIELAGLAANAFKQIVVLKGHRTVVADGERVYVNRTGDSSLSKAGTGDVLSGVIGSLMGQKMERFEAACAGVWLHGRAGELAGERLGRRSVLASDVIDALPEAIRAYEAEAG